MKRDQYAVILAVILAYLVIILGKGRGILSLCSIGMNIVIFLYGLARYEAGDDLMGICVAMIVAFTVLTLFLVNGVNRRSAGGDSIRACDGRPDDGNFSSGYGIWRRDRLCGS